MSSKVNIPQIIAATSAISLLFMLMYFSFYKGINKIVDEFAYEALDFLSIWGIDLAIEQFWILLGVVFLLIILIIYASSD